jgi:hypothetical protein
LAETYYDSEIQTTLSENQKKTIYPYFVAYVASINGQMCNGMATIPRNSPIRNAEDVKNLQAFLQLQFYQLQNICVMNWIALEPIEEITNGEVTAK